MFRNLIRWLRLALLGLAMATSIAVVPFSVGHIAAAATNYDAGVNAAILSKASCYLDSYGGQCKAWLQQSVYAASGRYLFNYCSPDTYWPKRWLPQNQPSGDRWYSQDFAVVVSSGYGNISSYWCYMKPGNVVQFVHTAFGIATPHTVIICSASATGMFVIDSNWGSDGMVRYHSISKNWLDSYCRGWTLYQIR